MADRYSTRPRRRAASRHLQDGQPGERREPAITNANIPESFGALVWDKFREHLAEVLALSIIAFLTSAYFMFAVRIHWAELWLERWQVSGTSFALAVLSAELSGGVLAGLFVTRRFRRIMHDLRLRIASMERDTA